MDEVEGSRDGVAVIGVVVEEKDISRAVRIEVGDGVAEVVVEEKYISRAVRIKVEGSRDGVAVRGNRIGVVVEEKDISQVVRIEVEEGVAKDLDLQSLLIRTFNPRGT